MLEGFKRNFKPTEVSNEGQVDAIWEGIIDVLANYGLKFDVESPKYLDILTNGGCLVDYDNKMVRSRKFFNQSVRKKLLYRPLRW